MLFETVREAQKGSEEAKLELVERFQPTIRANAWKLNREDGKEEMTLAFLEILESMNLEKLRSREDGVIVAYFKKRLASCLLSQGRREHQATVGRLFDRQHRRARTRSGPCPGRLEHRWEGPLFFYPF